jgi:AcrR family transcriptional regulator
MNIKNNLRYKVHSEKIENAFLSLLEIHKYDDITISQICKRANINRSTFYCHYTDINDLIIKVEKKFAQETAGIFNFGERRSHEAMVEMFTFVKENKHFYNAFLNIAYVTLAERNTKIEVLKNIGQKLNIDKSKTMGIFYRASFFGAGIKEMCRLWLERDCLETPEQMARLLLEEYTNRP